MPVDVQAQLSEDAPVEITADSLDVYQDRQVAIFSGKVEAVQKDVTLNADRMTVFYRSSEETKGTQAQRISKIDVDGNVFLKTPKETAKGDKGIYYVDQKIVRLFGNVSLTQGKSIIQGDGMEYNMATGRSKVVSRASAGKQMGKPAGGGRVKGVFIPDKQ